MSIENYSKLHQVNSIHDCKRNGIIKALNDQGIFPNHGKWSKEEESLLERNMEKFLKVHNLKSYIILVSPVSKEDFQFRKRTEFLHNMCFGIKRYKEIIANKITTFFCKHLKSGYPEGEEAKQFWELHKIHGRKWSLIGRLMRRLPRHLLDYYYYYNPKYNQGEFTFEENKQFTSFMTILLKKDITFDWNSVSEHMQTRSEKQCRDKWINVKSKVLAAHTNKRKLTRDRHTGNNPFSTPEHSKYKKASSCIDLTVESNNTLGNDINRPKRIMLNNIDYELSTISHRNHRPKLYKPIKALILEESAKKNILNSYAGKEKLLTAMTLSFVVFSKAQYKT